MKENKNTLSSGIDWKAQEMQENIENNLRNQLAYKLTDTTAVDKRYVSFKDKRIVMISPVIDKTDRLIKMQLDDEVGDLKQEKNFLKDIVERLVWNKRELPLDPVLSRLRNDYENWRN